MTAESQSYEDDNKVAIQLTAVALDYPKNKKGFGRISEFLTGRFRKKAPNGNRFFRALEDVDLTINKGEVIGIMGPNGSGKSTLLRVIAGIYAPDNGSVKVKGNATLLAGCWYRISR